MRSCWLMLKRIFKLCPRKVLFVKHHSTDSSHQKLISLLQSCKRTAEIIQIHGLMVKNGLDCVPFTLSKLLAAATLDVNYAVSIFERIQNPNLYMYNTMLRAYSISDEPEQVFELFNFVRSQSILLDEFTFVPILKSSANMLAIWTGLSVHSLVLRSGFILFLNVNNTLMHFYCVYGKIKEAHQLFDEFSGGKDMVSWNTLMGGYLCVSQYLVVIDFFRQLHCSDFDIGKATILTVLSAAGELNCIPGGKSLHGYCVKVGFFSDLDVVSALISMYGKIGCISLGHKMFDEVDVKDVVLWNCLIDGYAKNGLLEEALNLLDSMKLAGLKPNASTLVGLLSACSTSGALALGQCLHDYVEGQHLVLDEVLGTALVDMYAKCGLLSKAIDVFERIEHKDVQCWTTMISGYGVNGEAKNAISLYHIMEEQERVRPNEVTFLAVLNACSHAGLVTEGISCFNKMVQHYGLKPKIEHYGCIVDLLGRAGLLEDSHKIIKNLPVEGDTTAWRALLAACRIYGDVELGEIVKEELEQGHDVHPADSLILASTYAIAGRIQDHPEKNRAPVEEVESVHSGRKDAGCSTIQLSSNIWEQG